MKSRLFQLLILSTLSLTSCSLFNFDTYTVIEKDIEVFDIDALDSTNKLSSGYQATIKAAFKEGQEYIPYVTLEQYASLYGKHLSSDVVSEVKDYEYFSYWTITKGGSYYFVAEVNPSSKSIRYGGSLEAAYATNDDPRDLKALTHAMNTTTENKSESGSGYTDLSYKNYGINSIKYNNQNYYPLSLLDNSFSSNSYIYFEYNYKHILSTRDVESYATKYYIDSGVEYSFDTQMESAKSDNDIPSYLVKFNAGMFLYTMDNFYGLKDYKKISSFAKYCKSVGVYDGLYSSHGPTRVQAYSDALSILDDNHTVLYSANDTWDESNFARRRYGEGAYNRSVTRQTLLQYRKTAYSSYQEDGVVKASTPEKDILYSQDGKTALFSFDSFEYGTTSQVFNDDNSIKTTAKNYDTFYKLIDAFNRIKAKGGVNNVILDIALNGGGVVGVLFKLLALISKDNTGYFCFYDDLSKQAAVYNVKVDSNGDGEYNALDCFGNDFNIYLLTSDASFSCGNAFPCIAQIKKSAKIIGQKSGGGECAVGTHYMPNSEYVYHSSNLHIGYFNETTNKFEGFESGATPDIVVPMNQDFYSIDNLNNIIKNA